ncbi:hypothetical protein SAMN02745166_03128 [Prosthecobacter debontii]|uniref:Uncharacterized protein n=1 Tax=Prosthecobacter debontii TaxID=48467 RepID=A0A1T4YEW4_9BACT|nr:hypothetical protein [Prosthecobacter debontii]SKB00362.1 hypothetical protein SAMN02745166_03128 [Prosthecobacter debontii]
MFVKPSGPRHTVTEQADSLVFRIPPKRNIFMLGFLTLWLGGWVVGELMAPIGFFTAVQKNPGAAVFMLVWFCFWTVGGAFAIYTWLWLVKGCEVVTISATALSIKNEIFRYGRTKHYDVSEIRDLRISPLVYNPYDFRSGLAFWGIGGGAIAFDYGFKTYRFGAGVDEAEARLILQTITSRLPQFVDASDT